jgi:hypothetical protein
MLILLMGIAAVLVVFALAGKSFAGTENTVTLGVRGDYGNPNGTGISRAVFSRVRPGTALSATEMATMGGAFHAAMVAAQLTGTTLGDLMLATKSPGVSAKPDDNVNVDRVLVCEWRTKTESSVHTFTYPGVPTSSTGISEMPEGERLNEVGKTAVAAAIETFYNITEGEVVVLGGKVIQKS